MDIIILGLLMTGNWTIYEMRKHIETSFTAISSNSMGSIQAAIKKLLENELVEYTEFVENSVNKKEYSITQKGKKAFLSRLSEPMRYKEKNIELSKFFFLGFIERNKQIELLDGYIAELQMEHEHLTDISNAVTKSNFDENYLNKLRENGAAAEIITPHSGKSEIDSLREIARFQFATLDLSIAKVEFELNWFTNFRNQIKESEAVSND